MSETKELTNFHYINLTDKGCVRTNNEDYLGYFDTLNGHVFVVCDGIGGLPCGEKASQTVVNSVKFFFSNYYYKDPFQALSDALSYANTRIEEEARNDFACEGMGTTVVLHLICLFDYGQIDKSSFIELFDKVLEKEKQMNIDKK